MIDERQKKTTKEYRDNWDRIFGETESGKRSTLDGPITSDVCDDPGCEVGGCAVKVTDEDTEKCLALGREQPAATRIK